MRTWMLLTSLGVLAFAAASCKVGPDYKPVDVEPPQAYKSAPDAQPAAEPIKPDWWKIFGDDQLSALEEQALASNTDLRAATARVAEARAAARSVGSQFYPVITLNPSATRARTPAGPNGNAVTANVVRVPFDLSYEIDIWGRVRRSVEAANAQAQASAADFGAVLQTLTADVAQNYFNIRSLDSQVKILADNMDLYRHQVSLTQTQHKAGIVGQTDVLQAQTQLDSTDAQSIDLQRQRADAEHALAILTGRPPSAVSIETKPLDLTPPVVPPGLPADLLRQRPDVAEAEQNLIGANAAVGVAKANFYPVLSLTGSAGYESIDITHALDWQNRFWSIGPSLAIPLFEGGKLNANLEQAKARYEELTATYRGTVLAAFRDVEDSLTDLHMRADAAQAQARAVDSSREYLRLTQLQYKQGLVGYLQVIDAERTLLNNELAAVELLNQRLVSTVLLIKALGGGWTMDDVDRLGHAETPEPATQEQ